MAYSHVVRRLRLVKVPIDRQAWRRRARHGRLGLPGLARPGASIGGSASGGRGVRFKSGGVRGSYTRGGVRHIGKISGNKNSYSYIDIDI